MSIPNWDSDWKTAITNARNSINTTDFDYITPASGPSQANWFDLNSSDTNIAGQAAISYDCAPNPNKLTSLSLYANFPHFSACCYIHGSAQKQCTAIHELGHGVGLEHNSETSIMLTSHITRCHSSLITTVQSHDTFDINLKY
jgi:hypothetical protein